MKNDQPSASLLRNVKVRLPKEYPWRVLNALVEDHSYCLTEAEVSSISHIIRTRDLEAYLKLQEDWGPCGINPHGTHALIPFRAKYQIASLLKKYRFPTSKDDRISAAKHKFYAAEQDCKSYNHSGYKRLRCLSDPVQRSAFTYAGRFLRRLLNPYVPEFEELTLWSRHGPGANLDTKQGRNSLYFKYSEWPYSCTQLASGYARLAIQSDERWLGALEDSYRERNDIPKHAIICQDTFWSSVIKIVPGNRVTFVPKNAQTERSIAIEPSMNLYLQLGVDGYIRRRLKRWGVDLDDQTKNQRLALDGSKNWRGEDPFVTLDLSAASDSVSLSICESLLPEAWYSYLLCLRSPVGELDGDIISYEKISSMGNGYTFALESAIFTALVYGVERALKGSFSRDDFAVYGDDIVIRQSSQELMVQMLNLSGFSLNSEKSFSQGPFRESCGSDFFNGESVRPVFLTEQPTTIFGLWCDRNRLHRMLHLRSLLWESKTSSLYERWIPDIFSGFVGPYSDTDFDSYKHVPLPIGRYRNSVWDFKRLVVSLRPLKERTNFLFRKLMNALRQQSDNIASPWSSKSWGGAKLSAGGNTFTVTDNHSVIVSVAPTQTSIWSGEYTTHLPLTR